MKINYSSLPNALAFVTVRLECSGADNTVSTGTGFVFDFGNNIGRIIVTNKHVIEGANFLTFSFTESSDTMEPLPGHLKKIALVDLQEKYVEHPDENVDLAAILLDKARMFMAGKSSEDGGLPRFYISSLDRNLIPSEDQFISLRLIEEIIMIGYPIGLWDERNNFPLLRRGITATHPAVDFDGAREFLIDCAVYPGSSGSPILRYTPEFPIKSGAGISITGGAARVELLGVLYAGYERRVNGEIRVMDIPTTLIPMATTNIPINVGKVIRSQEILEMESPLEELCMNIR